METIQNYLNNMFVNLPKTSEIQKMKSDLLSNMEDKYNELKSNGRSENEAIGIVISEFGNIDELIRELGIEYNNNQGEILPSLTEREVVDFINANKKSGKLVGIGVFLCILAAASLILINQLVEDRVIVGISKEFGDIVGLIPLFFLVAIAVGLFIYSGTLVEKFKYLEGGFILPNHLNIQVQQKNNAFTSTYTVSTIVGVAMCILSPVLLFIASTFGDDASTYGVIGLLIIVAIAVYIFIYFGKIRESYKRLLCLDEYSKPLKDKNDKVIAAVAAFVWPLAVCIFLISGFLYNQWYINWIVFPITGILFAMFSGVYGILKEKR
ncbi:permease prefix domain 1-containing protein [Clostridium sp.]|uniref:permease prefix domain 1-containing protein n=1 Tax=Clostridium sp. TaxID=1506 RepID=UPI002FC64558